LSLNSWNSGDHPSYSGFIRDISNRNSPDLDENATVD
jgi:hypothetical protein